MLSRKAGFEGIRTDFSARLALSRHRPNGPTPRNFFSSIFHTLYHGATQWCKFEIVTQKSSVDRERARALESHDQFSTVQIYFPLLRGSRRRTSAEVKVA